jgi:hypothetical protein
MNDNLKALSNKILSIFIQEKVIPQEGIIILIDLVARMNRQNRVTLEQFLELYKEINELGKENEYENGR